MSLTLPDGTPVSTGLIPHPCGRVSLMSPLEDAVPLLSMDEITAIAKAGTARGSDRFDSSYIMDQKSHGSCNGFAGAGALTRARVRRGLPKLMLSGAYLYSLMNGGRDSGSLLEDAMSAMQQKGIATAATVGWDAIYPSRYNRSQADAEAAQNKGFECYVVNSERALFSALALGFDCVVAVCADNGFMHLDSRGVAQGGGGSLNHAVMADGLWWDGELIADGVNSWSTSYGRQGRMGLTWNQHFRSTYQETHYYAVRSTSDGTDATPAAH